jgi:hypothetical protein
LGNFYFEIDGNIGRNFEIYILEIKNTLLCNFRSMQRYICVLINFDLILTYEKILYFNFSFMFIALNMSAQKDKKRDYIWTFGYDYESYGNIYDFNYKPKKIYSFTKPLTIDLGESVTNICDKNGDLFAIENGCAIFNRNYDIMKNGDKLNPSVYTQKLGFCEDTGSRIIQGSLMLPCPGKDSLIYLFHNILDIKNINVGKWITDTLRLTIINTKGDSGLGEVIVKNKPILADTQCTGGITATRHANGKDWWLLLSAYQKNGKPENRIISFLVKTDTILGPYNQNIGKTPNYKSEAGSGGVAVFSPDGKQYARYVYLDGLYLYDFDRKTGLLSNNRYFEDKNKNSQVPGIAFSSNSGLLYLTSQTNILQFDTQVQNLTSSVDTIAKWDGFTKNGFSTKFSDMRLAPDCKIYVTPQGSISYISVINHPNIRGKGCAVEQRIKTPTHIAGNFPNYPVYRLGAIGENVAPCDSTISAYITGVGEVNEKPITAAVYPNPSTDFVNVDLYGFVQSYTQGAWQLCNATGQLVATYPMLSGHSEYQFTLPDLPNGLYLWRLVLDGNVRGNGKLVILQ